MDVSNSFPWRRGLSCGLLWGVAVMLIDPLTQPFGGLHWQEALWFAAKIGFSNMAGGLVWSLGTEWMASHRWKLAIFALQLSVATVVSLAVAALPIDRLFMTPGGIVRLMRFIPPLDFICHSFWLNGICGGVYVLGYHATNRAIRLRQRLTELRLACGEADMQLREMRLQTYRTQIRPAKLLEALSELQLRYAIGRSAGDQLFDRLVDFLRAAMPSLRGGVSTLSAELAIVSSYAMLRNALKNDGSRWQLKISPLQADAGSNFIPLRVLASLDRIDHCVPQGQIIEVTTDCHEGILGVKVKISAACLSNGEGRQLKTDLESALGADAIVTMEARGDVSLDLRLPAGRSIENPKTHYHEFVQGAEDVVFPG
jgi:hypothetical protein